MMARADMPQQKRTVGWVREKNKKTSIVEHILNQKLRLMADNN